MTPDELLAQAAARAAQDPFYLAGALQTYQAQENLSPEALAAWLGCAIIDLPRLGLCRRPDENSARDFAADVTHLANRFGLHAERLANLLRQSAFFGTWALQITEPTGLRAAESPTDYKAPFLMAARDRDLGETVPEGAALTALSTVGTQPEESEKTKPEENAPDAATGIDPTDRSAESDNG